MRYLLIVEQTGSIRDVADTGHGHSPYLGELQHSTVVPEPDKTTNILMCGWTRSNNPDQVRMECSVQRSAH